MLSVSIVIRMMGVTLVRRTKSLLLDDHTIGTFVASDVLFVSYSVNEGAI